MLDILENFKEVIIQMLYDYKSRKFLIAVTIIGIVVLNRINDFGLSAEDLSLITYIGGAYVLIEGLADVASRIMDKFLPKEEEVLTEAKQA